MNELRLVQAPVQLSVALLGNRIDDVEETTDARESCEGQSNLSARIRRFEETINLHQAHDSLNRIARLETSVGQGRIGESLRNCRVRMNQLEAGLTELEQRIRTQDWYHDLSEQENSDKVHRLVDGRPPPRRAAPPRRRTGAQGGLEQLFTQLRNDVQNNGLDQGAAIDQRLTQFLTEDRRRETDSRNSLEQRSTQLRHEFQSAMVDHDTTFNQIAQEFRGRGPEDPGMIG